MGKKLVMLVTADEALTEIVELLLCDLDIAVLTTNDPAKLIRRLHHLTANLLLLDTALPDSLEDIKQIKANPLACSIPLVALSYDSSFDLKERAMSAKSAGADDVVDKTTMVADLQEKARKYVYRQTREQGC